MKRLIRLFGILLFLILPVLTVYAQKPDVDALLKQAVYETNISLDYPKAIDIAKAALALSPEYTDIRLILGRLYALTGETQKAREQLLWVINKYPSNDDALNYLINIESAKNNYTQAIVYIDQALRYSNSPALILKKALLLEVNKQYKEAYLVLEPLMENGKTGSAITNAYINIRVQAGKISMQASDWNNAEREYKAVLIKDPGNEIAISQLYEVEVNNKNNESALFYADQGLKYYPLSENFLFKKVVVLQAMQRPFDAYANAKVLVKRYPENAKAQLLLSDLYASSRQNRVGISYDYTFFDQDLVKPWHFGSVYYTREERFGSISGKLNFADRGFSGGKGYQLEIDAYPKHGKSYSYINVAYSNALIFPKFRMGYSYYANFKNGWEGEVGLRYINAAGTDFVSYGAAIGKYFKSYWFNLRPFLTIQNDKVYTSAAFTARKYLDQGDNYFTLIVGTGSSADDRAKDFQFESRYNLSSYRSSIGFQHLLYKTTILGLLGTINNQGLTPDKRRNEFDIFVNLQHKF